MTDAGGGDRVGKRGSGNRSINQQTGNQQTGNQQTGQQIANRQTANRQTGPEQLPQARRRRSRLAAWFWAIPLAALALVGWLATKEWLIGSGDVTVVFARAEGLSPGAAVRYRGASVGRVRDIRLADDLAHVNVVLRIEGPISDHIGTGTLFWIERPGLASGQIKNLIAGASVGVQPADGKPQQMFNGLEEPPVLPASQPGRSFVLRTDDAGGISPGAPVLFHGVEVGRVLGTRLAAAQGGAATGGAVQGGPVEVPVLVEAKYADFVRRSSAFWRAGGLSVSTGGGLDVNFPSLQSLISGAIAFDTPEAFAGPPAGPDTAFRLYADRDAAKAVPGGSVFAYFVRFPKAVGGLGSGAPVTLEGRQIGRVAKTGIDIDPETGSVTMPVEIGIDALALDPQAGTAATRDQLGDMLNQALAKLVRNGLRAKVASSGFLSMGKSVELAMASGAKPASLDQTHQPPAIPAEAAADIGPPPPPAGAAQSTGSGQVSAAPPAGSPDGGSGNGRQTPAAPAGSATGQDAPAAPASAGSGQDSGEPSTGSPDNR
jgi:paraquat-inducible protein B